MKKFILSILAIGIITCGCTLANNEKLKLSPKVQRMVDLAEKNDNNAIQLYKQFNDKEYDEFAKYLETTPNKVAPVYFIAIADHVLKTDKDKAVFFYFFGKLRATEDVMMCKDISARAQLQVYPLMAPETMEYAALNNNVKDEINMMQKTLDWDDKYPERVSPIWSCYHGMDAYANPDKEPELLPESEFPKVRDEVRSLVQKAIENRKDPEFVKKLNEFYNQLKQQGM